MLPAIELQTSLWTILSHPGSTNSSTLIRAVNDAMESMFDRLHVSEVAAARTDFQRAQAEDEGAKFQEPRKRQILAGGGSLSAIGLAVLKPLRGRYVLRS